MAYLNGDALPAARVNKNPIPYGSDPTRFVDDTFLNALRGFCAELQTVLYTGSGAPAGSAQKGALYVDLTNAVLYINTDGGTTWGGVGSSNASIAIATETAGDFDFTTLGALDWTFPEAWGTSRESNWHGKAAGGWLLRSFDYLSPQGASNTDTRGWLNHASSADDVNTIGLHNIGDTLGVTKTLNGYNGTGATGTGFRFRMPASPAARTLRWQGTMFNAQTLVSAKLSIPGLATPRTLAINTTASNGLDYRAAVTFSGPIGSEIVITHSIGTLIGGNSGNLYIGAIGCA